MYCIVRFHQHGSEVQQTGLTLEEARAHCQRADTQGQGWFDGYTDEYNRPDEVAAFNHQIG